MSSLNGGDANDSTPLVGRGVEVAVLRDAVTGLRAGSGQAIAILGPAGLGKSRLCRDVLTTAREARLPVLVGRAVPGVAAVPYRAVRESLLSWTRSHPLPPRDRLGGSSRALDQLLDEAPPDGQPLSPVFIAEAYLRLLQDVGDGGGCVLLLEDLHWADDETLAVVEYVADHCASTSVLVVLTYRPDVRGAARPLLDSLSTRGSLRRLPLSPLDRAAVEELVAAELGGAVAPDLVDLLDGRSEGVPLLVEELLAALRSSHHLRLGPHGFEAGEAAAMLLPRSVAETVRSRLEPLPEAARLVLETAAVFGRSFEWERLASVADCDQPTVLEALRIGMNENLLEADPARPGGLRFRHALIRDAVTSATFPPQRAVLARRALDLLQPSLGEGAHDEELALGVELASLCNDNDNAARMALRVAARAFDRWSLGTAERWLVEARRLASNDESLVVDIDVLQLRVATLVGRIDVVRTIGRALLVRLPEEDLETRLETHLRLGQVAAEDGRWQESQAQLTAARALLPVVNDPCAETRYELWSAVACIVEGRLDDARRHGLRSIELATPHDDQVDLVCAALLHLGRAQLPDLEEARRTWHQGLALATDHGLRLWRGRLLCELGGTAVVELRGDAELEESSSLAREAGAVELAQRVELLRAELALLRGRFPDASRHLEQAALAADRSVVIASTQDRAAMLRGLLAALHGDPPETGADDGPIDRCLRGVAALARDDLAVARTCASPREALARPVEPYAAVLALLDDEDPTSLTTAAGVVGAGVHCARAALTEAMTGDADRAALALAQAATSLASAPWLAAMTVRIVAPAVIAAGGSDHIQSLLRDAAATFARLALEPPADACRSLLREAGVPVPRRASAQTGVPDGLRELGITARELDVLRLVAEGLSSRDVAEQLYLSPRTVEKHVERLLAKTGSPNRTALAALARTTDPVPNTSST